MALSKYKYFTHFNQILNKPEEKQNKTVASLHYIIIRRVFFLSASVISSLNSPFKCDKRDRRRADNEKVRLEGHYFISNDENSE